ncbi:MAG: glycosyltransferase family 2 protein [Flavobacteriales bacterium]|nr:glycosyltransferase family 2 protein [Leptospiraceae bacterium]MCB9336301.1 glycosyltransferase family 2 protein [Flavobacteriales bacterium]
MSNYPLFSLVLRTKNEIKNIENFVESVKAQTYQNIEFIVIDNYSTDGTYEYLIENNITVYQKGPERVAQGNYGMLTKSTGKYVGYFDADMILSPNLIESAVRFLEDKENVIALHIREIILGKGFLSSVRRFERSFYEGTLVDAARIFLRSALLEVGGFDEENFKTPSAEDWDLDKRIKSIGEIAFLDSSYGDNKLSDKMSILIRENGVTNPDNLPCFYHNEKDFSLKWYLKKKKYYSKSLGNYISKWGKDDPDLQKQLGVWYRYFFVFVEDTKFKKIFAHPIYFVSMYLNLFFVGLTFLLYRGKK